MATSGSENYVLLTRLADEFAARYRTGERPSLQEYIDRYPELADDIRELFPAMVEMEQVKEDHQEAGELAAPPSPALQQLGDFRILREVGKGGMGIVYEAEQVSLGRHVALKVLPRNMLLDARAKRRFEREAKSAAKLHHTNIVPVFGVGEQDGMPYYVMQFIHGLGLDEVLQELKNLQLAQVQTGSVTGGPLRVSRKELSAVQVARSLLTGELHPNDNQEASPATVDAAPMQEQDMAAPRPPALSDSLTVSSSSVVLPGRSRDGSKSRHRKQTYWQSVARIGVQVADALEYAHKQGVVHRDIKPSNLLLDTQGTVWVTDFGLAKADDQQNLTHTGDILGTLRYMPPEAFEGKSDARGDVYSLGLTLYEMLAFRPAFDEKERNRLIRQVTHEEPTRLRKLNRQVPQDLETIVHKAIDKVPKQRYASASELAEDLQRFIEDEPIKARRISSAERLLRWARRSPVVATLLAAVALLLVGVAVVSTIAAFRIASARDEATVARNAAMANARQAEDNAEQSRRRLVHQYVTTGERLADAGDLTPALAWFAEALDLDRGDASREEVHRIRLASILNELPRLARVWHQPEADEYSDFTPDGRRMLAISKKGTARVWDVEKQEPLTPPWQDSGPAKAGVLSPNGRYAALLGADQRHRLWDVETGRPITGPLPDSEGTYFMGRPCTVFSPDSRHLAIASFHGHVTVWETATGQRRGGLLQHGGAGSSVALSPDGRRLASAGPGPTARVWDVASGQLLFRLSHKYPVLRVAFSPDGGRLLTVSLQLPFGGEARLFDTKDGKELQSLEQDRAMFAAFSPDGQLVLTAGNDAKLWNVATGKRYVELGGHSFSTHAVFSVDGNLLATVDAGRTVQVWDVWSGLPLMPPLKHGARVGHVAFGAGGRQLITATQDGVVRRWELRIARPGPRALRHDGFNDRAAFSPDGRLVATTGDNSVRLWETATGRALARLPYSNLFLGVAFSPDGAYLATAGQERKAGVWRAETGTAVTPYLLHTTRLASVAFSPDSRYLVAAGGNYLTGSNEQGEARIWEIATARQVGPTLRYRSGLARAEFSPDGKLVLLSGAEAPHVWDIATGHDVTPPSMSTSDTPWATFHPSGRWVAEFGGNGTVRMWDLRTGQDRFPPLQHGGSIFHLVFSPDGRRLVTCSQDQTARLWDAETGQPLSPPWRHGDFVFHASFSPDGRRVATAGHDGKVRLWDVATGQMLVPPLHHGGGFGWVRFSPDGRHLLTSNFDDRALVWDVSLPADDRPAEQLVAAARLVAGWRVDSRGGLALMGPAVQQETWQALADKPAKETVPSPSNEVERHRQMAGACERAELWEGVLRHLNAVLEQEPGRWQDWSSRGKAFSNLSQWARAIADYDRAIALGAEGSETWYRKGVAHHDLQQWDKALLSLTRALDRDPNRASAWHYRAAVNNALRRYERALADADKAIELGDKSAWLRAHRAVALKGVGRTDEAIRDMTEFLASEPNHSWSLAMRGEWYGEQQKWREAADDFTRAFEVNPDQDMAGYKSALMRLQAGDTEGYRKFCPLLLERADKVLSHGQANNLVWACVLAPGAVDDPKRLVQRMEKAIGQAPGPHIYLNTLGGALYRAGRHGDAVRRLSEGIAANGKGGVPQDWLFLAMAHHHLGHADESRKWLAQSIRAIEQTDPKKPTTGNMVGPLERIEVQLLRREAQTLIDSSTPGPKKPDSDRRP
jgi:WD40 repeat protein/serine/threonine protein kinase